MNFKATLLILFIILSNIATAQLYVALDGSDTNPGTKELPLKTITRAIALAAADSTIYIRGGVHEYSTTQRLNKSGAAGKPIRLFAYPGEKVVIDFSSMPVATASRGFQISHNYWHVKGLEIKGAGDNGIYISAWYTVVENCRVYKCSDTGIQLSGGASYNKIINCDSYENCDILTAAENADGFAAKLSIGPGNEFKGCRAWLNADDGWDLYEGGNPVLIDSCWAFRNGINIWGITGYQGDGNGFKLGGNYIVGLHTITRSLAFDNKSKGFDQNNNAGGVKVYNNTSFRNTGKNYSFPSAPNTGQHELKNNIGYTGTNSITASSLQTANSWNGFTIGNSDFISIDTSLVLSPRGADSSLPVLDFMKLAQVSTMIDAGVNVGLPFAGAAPDLGAFETGVSVSVSEKESNLKSNKLPVNFPNPFTTSTTIRFFVEKKSNVNISLYNIAGIKLKELTDGEYPAGEHTVVVSGKELSTGIYFVRITANGKSKVIKTTFIK